MNNVLAKVKAGTLWFLKSFLWLIPILLVLDVVSKLGLEKLLHSKPGWAITVIPGFFRIALLYNDGAAWGMFAGRTWLLVTISVVAAIAMIGFLVWKYKSLKKYQLIALCLMIPGAIGNLIDRAFYKHGVIDFLEFTFGDYAFPTFNLADSYLVIGVFIFLIGEIVIEVKNSKAKKTTTTEITSASDIATKIQQSEEELKEEENKHEDDQTN